MFPTFFQKREKIIISQEIGGVLHAHTHEEKRERKT